MFSGEHPAIFRCARRGHICPAGWCDRNPHAQRTARVDSHFAKRTSKTSFGFQVVVNAITKRVTVSRYRNHPLQTNGLPLREFTETNINVFKTGTRTRDIPVVEVDHVNVMTLIKRLPAQMVEPGSASIRFYPERWLHGTQGWSLPSHYVGQRSRLRWYQVEAFLSPSFHTSWPSFSSA